MYRLVSLQRLIVALFVLALAYSPISVSQSLSDKMDIRILIDVSGSMKKTDPNQLRIPALQVLTQLLPIGSQAGVWQFADAPKVLVPHGVVDSSWQQQAVDAAKKISSKGQFTDIGAALKAAAFSTTTSISSQPRQLHLILLTDGMVDVSKDADVNLRARRDLLEPILQSYIDAGARVHTIGLSHKADERTLSAMAQRTDGLFAVAENADQLLDIFLRALDNTLITQQVPVSTQTQTFEVQKGVASLTIVVEKNGDNQVKLKTGEQGLLEQQQQSDDLQWQTSSTHDVIRIEKPVEGTWALVSDKATLKRVNVEGQLQIFLQQSHQNLKLGQRAYIDVQLAHESGQLLTANQLQGFTVSLELALDGNSISTQSQVFEEVKKTRLHLPVINEAGMYDLNLTVSNGALVRTVSRSLRVHPLVAAVQTSQSVTSLPPVEEINVTESNADLGSAASVKVQSVSNEKASPALQALMDSDKPQVDTAASHIAELVSKVKKQTKSAQQSTNNLSSTQQTVVETNGNVVKEQQPEPDYWRWLLPLTAALVLVVIWFVLRRSRIPTP